MNKITHRILTALICVLALGWIYVSVVLMIGSGFIFGDIDFDEAQMRAAESKAYMLSIFGFLSLCMSVVLLLFSGRVARVILRCIGMSKAA
jgi:hypothetical protein